MQSIFIVLTLLCGCESNDNVENDRLNRLKKNAYESFIKGNNEKAYLYQDSVIMMGEKNLNTLNDIGLYAKNSGRFVKSKEYFLQALKLSKNKRDSTYLIINLLSCLIMKGDYTEAIEYSNSIVPEELFKFDLILLKSQAYFYNRDYNKSISILKEYGSFIKQSDILEKDSFSVLKYYIFLSKCNLALDDTLSYCTNYKIAYQLDTITANFLDSTICK